MPVFRAFYTLKGITMTDSALNLLGVDLDVTYTSTDQLPAAVEVGTEVVPRNGRAILAKAVSGTPQFSLVVIELASAQASTSCHALLASTGNCTNGRLAIAQTSVGSAEWGWFHTEINKEGRVNAATACQPNVRLYVTTTGGVVDDATVSAGPIQGLFIKTSATSASAPPCVANNMVVVQNAGGN